MNIRHFLWKHTVFCKGCCTCFKRTKITFFLENVLTSKTEFVCSASCGTQMSIKWYSSISILHGFNHFSRKKYQQTACFLSPQLTCAEMCIRVHDYVKEPEIPYLGGRKLHSWLWVNTPVNHIRICLLWKGNTDNFIRIFYQAFILLQMYFFNSVTAHYEKHTVRFPFTCLKKYMGTGRA